MGAGALKWVLAVLFAHSAAGGGFRGPPRIVSRELRPLQVVRLGQEFRVICPVEGDPAPLVDWYKDEEPITPAWSRYRVTAKSLRIRTIFAEDAGIYECKGVNGFGSQSARIRLVVVDDGSFPVGNEESPLKRRGNSMSAPVFTVPVFSQESLEQSGPMQLSSGTTIRLLCEAKGYPAPKVTWLKDGKAIGDKMWRQNSWTLLLSKLAAEDSGTFTCVANSSMGKVEFSINLHVTELRDKKKPELVEGFPHGLSVLSGTEGVLKCAVKTRGFSAIPPHIRWLKRVAGEDAGKLGRHKHRLLPVENQHVLVIQETHDEAIRINETERNGTYVSKLILSKVEASDEGIYICLATNSVGYTFKEATLTVIEGAEIVSSSASVIPFPVFVIGTSVAVALLLIGAAWALRRHGELQPKQRKSTSPRKHSSPSMNSGFLQKYDQRHLLPSIHSSGSSSTHLKTNPFEPTIEFESRCSYCDLADGDSDVSSLPPIPTAPRHYEECCFSSRSHSHQHCGHWR